MKRGNNIKWKKNEILETIKYLKSCELSNFQKQHLKELENIYKNQYNKK
jgi:hypothetical protein